MSNSSADSDAACPLHVLIPEKLAFVFIGKGDIPRMARSKIYGNNVSFVTTELHWRYNPFAADFGPVNLAVVYRFCNLLTKRLEKSPGLLVYCIERNAEAVANASFLLGAYMVLQNGDEPAVAADFFTKSSLPCRLIPFRDATSLPQDYDLTLLDCLSGLALAVKAGWFDMNNFNLNLFEALENPENGDIHQICPKFVAMKGPLQRGSAHLIESEIAFPPEHYASILKRLGVTCVVRLNDKDTYDKDTFEKAGIRHYDLYFDDCTIPSDDIVDKFLAICAKERRVAVHCRAGLGRTGTLMALWMMHNAGFGANEAIAWLRIVRPGSVIGRQQHYLKAREVAAADGGGLAGGPRDRPDEASPSPACSSAQLSAMVTAAMRDREVAKAAFGAADAAAAASADAAAAAAEANPQAKTAPGDAVAAVAAAPLCSECLGQGAEAAAAAGCKSEPPPPLSPARPPFAAADSDDEDGTPPPPALPGDIGGAALNTPARAPSLTPPPADPAEPAPEAPAPPPHHAATIAPPSSESQGGQPMFVLGRAASAPPPVPGAGAPARRASRPRRHAAERILVK